LEPANELVLVDFDLYAFADFVTILDRVQTLVDGVVELKWVNFRVHNGNELLYCREYGLVECRVVNMHHNFEYLADLRLLRVS
jgi:hypothetical protein